jgi:hypothetical protein
MIETRGLDELVMHSPKEFKFVQDMIDEDPDTRSGNHWANLVANGRSESEPDFFPVTTRLSRYRVSKISRAYGIHVANEIIQLML